MEVCRNMAFLVQFGGLGPCCYILLGVYGLRLQGLGTLNPKPFRVCPEAWL